MMRRHCRETSRPAFVDMRTYRFKGHSMSDPRKYRTKEEEDVFEADDPIGKLQRRMMEAGVLAEDDFRAMQRAIREQVRDAVAWSDASPPPPLEELNTDVFLEPWGQYTGSTQPQMNGGTTNPPGSPTIATSEDLS